MGVVVLIRQLAQQLRNFRCSDSVKLVFYVTLSSNI